MAEIVFRLPSKAVQYGYVEVKGTPEELGIPSLAEADAVGVAYATYVAKFLMGEVEGAKVDVAPPRTIREIMSNEDVDTVAEAQVILDKELGGVTEVSEEGEAKPWNKKPEAKKKPWEQAAKGAALPEEW